MKRKNSVLLTIFFLLLFFFGIKIISIKLVIPESESVNGSLFLIQDKSIKNDYVIFEYNKESYKAYQHGKLFIKRIACDSGQHLKVENRQVFCDNKLIATGLDKNGEGKILPNYEYDQVIPDNQFFAMGDNPRSFDSRYFGLVNKEQIKNSAKRIF